MSDPVPRLQIRPYDEADLPGVTRLWQLVFPDAPAHNRPQEDISRKLAVQRRLFLLALMDEEVVGTAMAGYDGHRGWVYYVAVHPAWRRQGIGARLMSRVESDLLDIGCPKLNLQVRASNSQAVNFYKKLGYQVEERVSMGKRL